MCVFSAFLSLHEVFRQWDMASATLASIFIAMHTKPPCKHGSQTDQKNPAATASKGPEAKSSKPRRREPRGPKDQDGRL